MKIRFSILLLLLSCFAFSQTITPVDVTRGDAHVSRKERKRRLAEEQLATNAERIEQNGDTVTTWNLVLVPGVKNRQWRKIRVATYVNSEPHGLFLELSEWGDTTTIGTYCHGRYSGEWKSYSAGKVSSIRNYDTLGNKLGLQLVADANGQVVSKQFYTSIDNYYWWSYCENGSLLFRGAMSAKGKEGVWYEYRCVNEVIHPGDTLPITISEWRNGKLDGLNAQYYRGVPVLEMHYRNGIVNGIFRKYESGILRMETSYINNSQNGQYFAYTATGKLQEISGYVLGTLDGEHVIFDTLTNVKLKSTIYRMGIELSFEERTSTGQVIYNKKLINEDSMYYRVTEYYDNGKIKSKWRLVDGHQTGKYESWHENGRRMCTATYMLGRVDGPVYAWNENGLLVYKTTTDAGQSGADEMVWDDHGKRLESATLECDSQAKKYAPSGLRLYTEFGYEFPVVTIAHSYPYRNSKAQNTAIVVEEIGVPLPRRGPQFPGGEEERVRWLHNNLQYPVMDRELGIQGTNYVRFTVNADSTITDVELVKGVSNGIDKELLRVTKKMPKWKTATRNGKAVRSKCVMSVRWVLE